MIKGSITANIYTTLIKGNIILNTLNIEKYMRKY